MRVLVVGSGIAGLTAAIRADAAGHHVTVVTKAGIGDSNTAHAQGGIAAARFADDSPAAHAADTLRAGAGLADAAAVRVLCEGGPAAIRVLIDAGVGFDLAPGGDGEFARGLEAAHSTARVLHAGGDASGAVIEGALVASVLHRAIEIQEHTMLVNLLSHEGRVSGIEVQDAGGSRRALTADAVLLATGGAGALFAHTTNPALATGDGVAAAWRAGAQLADLEFYQFHPTALALDGHFLVSEAVRGEGAVLLNDRGERFMVGVHPDAELAPRDVVARAIAEQMVAQCGRPVLLDATALGASVLESRFPTITRATRAAGLDWSRIPIPVTPAAHYWMGGVVTDTEGRTALPGLFAIGEVARTGVHGANRLASNSLLEGAVFAARAVDALGTPTATATASLAPARTNAGTCARHAVPATPLPGVSPDSSCTTAEAASEWTRHDLQQLMWESCGLARNKAGLELAAATLARWTRPTVDPRVPASEVRTIHENANLLDLARLTVAAALARTESLGAHFRSDTVENSASNHSAKLSPIYSREDALAC